MRYEADSERVFRDSLRLDFLGSFQARLFLQVALSLSLLTRN